MDINKLFAASLEGLQRFDELLSHWPKIQHSNGSFNPVLEFYVLQVGIYLSYACLFISLSMCLFVYLSICLFVYSSVSLSLSVFASVSVCLSTWLLHGYFDSQKLSKTCQKRLGNIPEYLKMIIMQFVINKHSILLFM